MSLYSTCSVPLTQYLNMPILDLRAGKSFSSLGPRPRRLAGVDLCSIVLVLFGRWVEERQGGKLAKH